VQQRRTVMAATQPAGTWATTETEPALLAGLAVCSACGARLTRRSRPHGTGKARTRVLFYRCSSISAVPGVREHGQRLGEAQGTMDVRSSQEGIKGVRGGVIATHGDHDGEVRLLGQSLPAGVPRPFVEPSAPDREDGPAGFKLSSRHRAAACFDEVKGGVLQSL
jgi:hypothetical protein